MVDAIRLAPAMGLAGVAGAVLPSGAVGWGPLLLLGSLAPGFAGLARVSAVAGEPGWAGGVARGGWRLEAQPASCQATPVAAANRP